MKNKMFSEKTSVLYQTRYCAQEDFSIAVCMDTSLKRLEFPFSMNNYVNSKQIDSISMSRYNSKLVTCGSSLFVISESRQNSMFEKYHECSGNKIVLPSLLDNRSGFCFCSFMQKIYVIGGYRISQENIHSSINSCMCYDTISNKWNYIASMRMNGHNFLKCW